MDNNQDELLKVYPIKKAYPQQSQKTEIKKEQQENYATGPVPEKKSVILIIFLTIITLGVYPFFWFLGKKEELKNLRTKTKPYSSLIPSIGIFIWFLFFVSLVTSAILIPPEKITEFFGDKAVAIEAKLLEIQMKMPIEYFSTIQKTVDISLIATIILLVIILISLSFKTKKIIDEALANKGSKTKLSIFYTLIYNLFYIQYEINRVEEDKEENPRKAPLITTIILAIFLISLATLIILIEEGII